MNKTILLLALAIGAVLRGMRVGLRWDEVALAYSAYSAPTLQLLHDGAIWDALTHWMGLHPPLYPLLHSLMEVLVPIPLVWLVWSAACSLASVAIVGRLGGPIAALVMATAPTQLADAAEVNNYSMAVLAMAGLLWVGKKRWTVFAAVVVLSAWTHVLAGAAAVGLVVWRLVGFEESNQARRRWIAAAALGIAPVLVGGVRVVMEPGNWSQPPVETAAWLNMLWETLGLFGIVVAIVGMMGLRGIHLAQWLALTIVLGASLLMGAAAGHQRAYLCLFGPSLALGIGHLLPGLGWPVKDKTSAISWGFILVLVLGLRSVVGQSALDIREIARDLQRTRAVDVAIERSVPGDGIWLVTPALQPDDDKQAISLLLWRFKPWNRMAMAQPVAFAFEDWSYGQPRIWKERVVHTSTELDPAAFDHVMRALEAEGRRMYVTLADHGPAAGLEMRVNRVLRPYRFTVEPVGEDRGMGTDRLFLVTGTLPQ